jgi:hypothetical protein
MSFDLTGVWNCDDGGTYYIRQIGNEISWFGESSSMNPSWSNIAWGNLSDKVLNLQWRDVPKGRNMLSGTLQLQVISNNAFKVVSKEGKFGGSTWGRV